jgi:hypothetical protein
MDSPFGIASLPILLKDEHPDSCVDSGHQNSLKLGAVRCPICGKPARKWYLRHINTKQQGRIAQVRAKGMIPVEFSELLRSDEIADLHGDASDGLVHTGISGTKVLYKIPLDLYNARKRHERDAHKARLSSPRRMREDLANDAGGKLGSEAADTIYSDFEYSERKVKRTSLESEMSGGDDEDDE